MSIARSRGVGGYALAFAMIAASCSAASPASTGPYTTVTSDSGALHIEVSTTPQPPVRGQDEAELTVTHASDGTPVDGLTVAVTPWMPAMDHGTSVVPTVAAEGGGKYVVSNLYLYMPGVWALQTSFSGPVMDHATAVLQIP